MLAALAVDAVVHFYLAPVYDPVRAMVSQGLLFRLEGAAAAFALLLLLVRPWRLIWAFAGLVLAGGFAAVVFYQFVDAGQIGPLPDMYDPHLSVAKVLSMVAEGVGAVVAGNGFRRAR